MKFSRDNTGGWQRFWRYVEKTDSCWLWSGRTVEGYGSVMIGGERYSAHRLMMYWMNKISSPKHSGSRREGMVLHTCDNKICVNPAHLYVGSHAQNIKDAWDRGRLILEKGASSPHASLTADQVKQIRSMYAAGNVTQNYLARMFGVSQPTISLVVLRKRYTEV